MSRSHKPDALLELLTLRKLDQLESDLAAIDILPMTEQKRAELRQSLLDLRTELEDSLESPIVRGDGDPSK